MPIEFQVLNKNTAKSPMNMIANLSRIITCLLKSAYIVIKSQDNILTT